MIYIIKVDSGENWQKKSKNNIRWWHDFVNSLDIHKLPSLRYDCIFYIILLCVVMGILCKCFLTCSRGAWKYVCLLRSGNFLIVVLEIYSEHSETSLYQSYWTQWSDLWTLFMYMYITLRNLAFLLLGTWC